jgi:hypothetical protein
MDQDREITLEELHKLEAASWLLGESGGWSACHEAAARRSNRILILQRVGTLWTYVTGDAIVYAVTKG